MPLDLGKFSVGTIVERRDVTSDLWTIRLELSEPFLFRSGQYATIGVLHNEKMVERAYSIVSSPIEPQLELFIELVPEGKLTPLLYKLHVGDSVYVRKGSHGQMTFDDASGHRSHVMLCTVTGVAPFVSMVRTFRFQESEGGQIPWKLYLLEGASRSWELTYDHELRAVEEKHPWFRYVPSVSRPNDDPEWRGEQGRVHTRLMHYLEHFSCNPDDTTVYLCGHPGMIEEGKRLLLDSGFDPKQIREERYWIERTPQ